MIKEEFLLGAATAAHQVEGNNIHSDYWAMEGMENSSFVEPSLDAADHYNRYQEDIDLLVNAGLNAYRFTIEWARIEPTKGVFDDREMQHYREVLQYCHDVGVTPIVTMHHFSSPKWLIESGGWESEETPERFASYCEYVIGKLGSLLTYICTINEANMGLQLASMIRDRMAKSQSDVQVGINFDINPLEEKMNQLKEIYKEIFGVSEPQHFLSQRTENGDLIIMQAHKQARGKMKRVKPDLKIGLTLSLHDFQAAEGGEPFVVNEWDQEFAHYIPFIKEDDFIGVQNYTRKIIGSNGVAQKSNSSRATQMGYEYYPEALENVIRKVHQDLKIPIIVTENGIGAADDQVRIDFIRTVMSGVESCIADGIPVLGYMHWSLLDNFEWQLGFSKTFGLIAVNRETQERLPKESLRVLGSYRGKL